MIAKRRPRMWMLALALACGLALPAAANTHHRSRHRRAARHHRGEVGISPARARQIQAALERTGYLHHASGRWDAATRAAMKRYQRAHHWQTEFVPDSRALIALGLGPKFDVLPPAGAKTATARPPAA